MKTREQLKQEIYECQSKLQTLQNELDNFDVNVDLQSYNKKYYKVKGYDRMMYIDQLVRNTSWYEYTGVSISCDLIRIRSQRTIQSGRLVCPVEMFDLLEEITKEEFVNKLKSFESSISQKIKSIENGTGPY